MDSILKQTSMFESPRGAGQESHTTSRKRVSAAFERICAIFNRAMLVGLSQTMAHSAARDWREPGISDGFGRINDSRRALRCNPIRFRM